MTLGGRYRYVRELGRGATSRVVVVEDTVSGHLRAAKVVPKEHGERLRWEFSRLAALSHSNLTAVCELLVVPTPTPMPFGLRPGALVLVSELAPGMPSSVRAASCETLADRVLFACHAGGACARALSAIHQCGLVHGDVKPSNIIVPDAVAEARDARLIDLGLAGSSGVGPVVGTPMFLAPEAWLGERTVRTDLFALGVTLRLWLVPQATTMAGAAEEARNPRAREAWADHLPEGVPDALRSLIRELVAEHPTDRPSSAREVLRRLLAIGDSGHGEPVPRRSRRRERGATLLDQPSDEERAQRAGALQLCGRARELESLVTTLAEPGVVIVHGPPGSGRTRLIRDAVLALQAARAAAGLEVPTWITGILPSRLEHATIVHDETGSFSIEHARAKARAAALDGVSLTIVVEQCKADEQERRQIGLGPVDAEALAAILKDALHLEILPAGLIKAAREASAGLPGRLCRLIAAAFTGGYDPTRVDVMRRLARTAGSRAAIPEDATELAESLALSGGALRADEAHAITAGAELARQALLLTTSGLASMDDHGLVLRADCARAIEGELSQRRKRALARALDRRVETPLARACVNAALGRHEDAWARFAALARERRDEGQPLAAAEVLDLARRRLPRTLGGELSIALADALRAAGAERDACSILVAERSREAIARYAELMRLTGEAAHAERLARDLYQEDDAAAHIACAVLARLAWTRGELGEAAHWADRMRRSDVIRSDPRALARLLEIEALIAISSNDAVQSRALALELERVAAEIPGHEGIAIRARASSIAGTAAWATMREQAPSAYERAAELAARAGERHATASATVNLGLSLLDMGRLGPAIDALRRGAHQLMLLERPRELGRALFNLANAAFIAGDDRLAEHAAREAHVEARAVGDLEAEVHAGMVLGDLEIRAGRLRSGIRIFESLARDTTVSAVIDARLAIAFASLGELEPACAHLESARRVTPPDSALDAEVAIAEARVALGKGELAEGEALAQRALVVSRTFETRLRAALLAAEIAEVSGRRHDASLRLSLCRSLLDNAASELDQASRARLRQVSAYARALAMEPAATSPGLEPSRSARASLIPLARQLIAQKTPERVMESLASAALDLTSAERAFVIERSDLGEMRLVHARGLTGPLGREHSPSRSIAARVIDERRALVTVDAMDDARLDGAASVHAMALRSVLAVPLGVDNERPRVLYVDDRQRPGAFDERTVDELSALADLGTVSLAAAQRYGEQRRQTRLAMRRERIARRELERQREELHALGALIERGAFAGIVAVSAAMREVIALASRVAASDLSVLIVGESGTGKEILARAIHAASSRHDKPFVVESCAAIPEGLLESTLFGHVRGAFTGALHARRGLFEIAHGGSLFLDEIGEMSAGLQPKLLRALEEGEIRLVGSERTRQIDVRIIAATHRNLMDRAREGLFREDLYYRLAVVTIEVPPLRERLADIAPLSAAFLERHAKERRVLVHPETLDALRAHTWPGNVRELENELRRALLLAEDVITPAHLSEPIRRSTPDSSAARQDNDAHSWNLKARVEALERSLVTRALAASGRNQTRAASLLGVSRFGLQKMLKRLQIPIDSDVR